MNTLVRHLTRIGFHDQLSNYEQKRILVFNYCNLLGLLSSGARLIHIIFFSSNDYTDITIAVNFLPLTICLVMMMCLHFRKYSLATHISFLCFPPALLAVYCATHDPNIGLFLILYFIFPFFFLHRWGNIIFSFTVAVICFLSIQYAGILRLMVYEKDYYSYDQVLALIDSIFALVFIFSALYAIKFMVWSYEKSIRQKKAELNELNQFKNKMFSIISHDLRSPFAATSQLLTLLQKTSIKQEEFNVYISELNRHVNATRGLIDNMLDWTKKQMDNQKILIEKTNIADIVRETFEVLTEQAGNKQIRLIDESSSNWYAMADRNMITVVIRNLVNNAIKFTKPGGYVKVQVSSEGDDAIRINIEDNGIGIPEHKKSNLLGNEYFTTSGTSNEKGSGLGLKICKDFIEKNKGTISFTSVYGSGTSFYITLPRCKEEIYTVSLQQYDQFTSSRSLAGNFGKT